MSIPSLGIDNIVPTWSRSQTQPTPVQIAFSMGEAIYVLDERSANKTSRPPNLTRTRFGTRGGNLLPS